MLSAIIDLFDMLLVVNTPHEEDNCIIRPVFPMVLIPTRAVTSRLHLYASDG